MIVFEVAKGK